MTQDRRDAGAGFKGRRNGLRIAAGAFGLASLIAAGVGFAAPGSASTPEQALSYRAGPNEGFGTASSLNWAGWAVSGGTFSRVAGSWVQPHATKCPAKTSEGAAFWVGIDGLAKKDKTVEQTGTDSDCVAGSPSYYAWYQMYPKAAVFLSQSTYPVVPGETIAAQVSASGKTFTLAITATSGGVSQWHYSTKQTVTTLPAESSAEWITEAPCVGSPCTDVPLSDFASVNFSGLSVTGKATKVTQTEITMKTSSGVVRAKPSALSPSGTAFKVTWEHS